MIIICCEGVAYYAPTSETKRCLQKQTTKHTRKKRLCEYKTAIWLQP